MTAERIIVRTVEASDYAEALNRLDKGWKLDPFFHKTGRPLTVEHAHVWVLVKGTPREIQALNPFVQLPEPQMSPEDQAFVNKWKDVVDVVEIKAESITDGTVAGLVARGYEVNNVLKGLVSLVKREKPMLQVVVTEDVKPGEILLVCPDVLDEQGNIIAEKVARIVVDAESLRDPGEPPMCPKNVHEPLKGDVLVCQSCDDWVAEEPGVTPTCSWDGWETLICKYPDSCLIERGPLFDAIKAMDDCKGCPKHEAFLKGATIEEGST